MTKIYIKTYGCSLNQADSESVTGLLKAAGFNIVDNIKDADLIIINTCIVKKQTENSVMKYIKELPDKPKIIAGCMSQIPVFFEELEDCSLIGTDQIKNIVQVVEETLAGNAVVMVVRENPEDHSERLNLPKIRRNKFIDIIPICKGCLGECSYCVVRFARGSLYSYSKKAIVEAVQKAVIRGAKEIWLTSQDCGAYGKDIGESLPGLLNELVKIEGDFKIRVGMANPNFVKEYLNELVEIFKNDKLFKFLHIPVQSGNDAVLRMMKRKYNVKDFIEIVKKFREAIPEIAISTDVIVGFPGESEEQFKDSLELIKQLQLDVLNLSRYFPRPKTEAAELVQLPGGQVKDRSRLMNNIFTKIAKIRNEIWLDWEGSVIVDEEGKEDTMVGRNYCYKPVIIKGGKDLLGKELGVKIKKVTAHDLRGDII